MSRPTRRSRPAVRRAVAQFIESLETRCLLSGSIEVLPSEPILHAERAPIVASLVNALDISYDSRGIQTLSYNDVSLLNTNTIGGDAFAVAQVKRVTAGGSIVYDYDWQPNHTTNWNATTKTLTWNYAWGSVACQWVQVGDSRLNMNISVNNTSATDTIAGVDVYAMHLRFPNALPEGVFPRVGFGTEGPNVQAANYGSGVTAFTSDDNIGNLYGGLYSNNDSDKNYTVWLGTTPLSFNPGSWPVFDRPLSPGQSATYHVSLRFGAAGTNAYDLAPDTFAAFAAAYPKTQNWADHRPIGSLHPAGSGPSGRSATNPRGWFNDPTVDVTTQSGLAAWRTRLLAYADSSITELKSRNAQGMITWDIEGEQYPHAITYIGDPRIATTVAPELAYQNTIADYFNKFKAAGLRVGMTIRPQQFSVDGSGNGHQDPVADPAALLIDKINYAKNNWGVTLFYVDSNDSTDSAVFRTVQAAEPDVLLMGEHESAAHFGTGIPYNEMIQGFFNTSDFAIRTYPTANSILYVADSDMTANNATIVAAVARGDILLFRGWFPDTNNPKVVSAYQQAISAPGTPTALAATPGNGVVNLSWNTVSGSYVVYNVKRATTSGGPYTIVGIGVSGTSFADTTVTNGTQYYYVLSAANGAGESSNSSQASATPVASQAPTVATAAAASPSTVAGTTTNLSALGADDGGEANLTYTWAATAKPSGANDPTYSANGTNAAKNSTATFTKAGAYTLQVTIKDANNLTVTSSVNVTVNQTLTTITVTPSTASVANSATQQFSAVAKDQFGANLTSQPGFTWSVDGGGIGSASASGLYTAPASGTGNATVRATSSAISGTAAVTVTAAQQAVALINAGGGASGAWTADGSFAGGSAYSNTDVITTTGVTNPAPQAVYQSERYGNFTYTVGSLTAGSAYTVRLHFAEIYWTAANQRKFNVSINGTQVLSSFDIFASAGGKDKAIVQQFNANANGSGQIVIQFSTVTDNAKISGIEILGNVNAAPTVATPAGASPSTVTGSTTNLSVLGADDGGEAALTYTWSVTAKPSGANDPTFSANNSNAAKNSSATFTKAGTYTFLATIKDAANQTITSSVNVTVNQTLTTITLSPTTATVNDGATQQFAATAKDQFGTNLSSQPGFTWTIDAGGVGSVNASGLYTAPASGASTATVRATSGAVSGTATVTTNSAPTVATAAAATPSPVTGTTTALSVLGADNGGEGNLIYTWAITAKPSGAADPTFSANNSNAAKSSTATFTKAGAYTFQVTIKDALNLTTTSSVNVTVNQTSTTITVSPASATVNDGATQQFAASAKDQFGDNLSSQPTFTWSIDAGGVGSINSTGLYTAPASGASTATIRATVGSASGTATVTTNSPPTVATAAAASPATVTGTTSNLSVLGADNGGEGNLTYTWAITAKPSGAADPTFSANNTNAAKNSTATFSAAGSYTFQVTIKDALNLTTTSSVNVTVNQTVTTITLSPTTSSLGNSATQQFAATAKDQFGVNLVSPPTFTWSIDSGGVGSVNSSGLYSSPASGSGNATVRATSGSISGTAAVTVTGSGVSAPSNLVASAGSTSQINLSWLDNASNETGFKVDRATDSAFTQNLTTVTLGANVFQYMSTGLNNSTTYYYRVRATSTGGDSANTATASATTTATPSSSVPAGWTATDIGGATPVGSTNYNPANHLFTVAGGGADIQNPPDQFQYAYTNLSGDGSIIAHVVSQQSNGNQGAKLGVMIRASTANNSAWVSVFATPQPSSLMHWRGTSGAPSETGGSFGPWLKLVRTGNMFAGYYSQNGTTWNLIATASVTMGTDVLIGLIGCSHTQGTLNTGTMDNVTVTGSGASNPPPLMARAASATTSTQKKDEEKKKADGLWSEIQIEESPASTKGSSKKSKNA